MIHLQLDLARDGSALVGRIGMAGGPVRPFTGWIGLNVAIEELLEESPQVSAAEWPELAPRNPQGGLGGV